MCAVTGNRCIQRAGFGRFGIGGYDCRKQVCGAPNVHCLAPAFSFVLLIIIRRHASSTLLCLYLISFRGQGSSCLCNRAL